VMDNYFFRTEYDATKNLLRVGDDGIVWLVGEQEQSAAYLAWVEAGNTAEEWTGM
jgi:hypothetical protein